MIYLDHNATTPLHPQVLAAMQPYLTGLYGNAASLHHYGRQAKQALDVARQQVAALVNVQPNDAPTGCTR